MTAPNSTAHGWRFFRAGGFDQVRLDRDSDLLALKMLDQKLWVALSCPTKGLEFDARTLALIDSDNDGHIRAPELLAAIDWAVARLRTEAGLLAAGAPALPLAAIDDSNDDGRRLLAAARRLLAVLGRSDADSITVDEASEGVTAFAAAAHNGDGIVPVSACGEDAELAALVTDILATTGAAAPLKDRNGEPGIDRAQADAFFADARAWLAWDAQGQGSDQRAPTTDAYAAVAAIRDKVEDFFARTRLAAFDPRAAALVNGSDADFALLASRNLATDTEARTTLAALPLARIEVQGELPLAGGNPLWADALDALRRQAIEPLLGARDRLSETDWRQLLAALASHSAWDAAQPATPVATLGRERLQALVDSPLENRLLALIDADAALVDDFAGTADVERLARYVRDLAALANNFVSFRDFYTRRGPGIFQAGTLYLDGRSCELTVRVNDTAKHAAIATLSRICLVYCDCTRAGDKISIAAAFTAGDADQLLVGRNGVFYDRQGRDWDATIVKIVDHPISIRQAFWAPYRKAARMVSEQIQKVAAARAAAAEQQAAVQIATGMQKVEKAAAAPVAARPAVAQQAFDVGKFAGIFAALGLAVGAIGTALASVVTGFFALKGWQMPLAMGGLLLAVSGPSMLLAWFKLRSRTLGPILDANGWAVNARARINIPFGTALTHLARLPEGAERAMVDPYAEKKSAARWWVPVVVALVVAVALFWEFRHGWH
jgi:hypothetical protein